MKTNKHIQKWVEALRSGEYKQTTKKLQDEKGYCCLGVACKLFVKNPRLNVDGTLHGALPYLCMNDANYVKWLYSINEITNDLLGIKLSNLNDVKDFTFDEIADVIELLYIHKALD